MTDEKICPIMSRPVESNGMVYHNCGKTTLFKVKCLKDECAFWVPECPRLNAADRECESEDCIAMDRDFSECKGGCRLI